MPRLDEDQNVHTIIGDASKGYSLALHLVVSTLVGLGLGLALDKWLGTMPLFLLIFMILGFVAGMRRLYLGMMQPPDDEMPETNEQNTK